MRNRIIVFTFAFLLLISSGLAMAHPIRQIGIVADNVSIMFEVSPYIKAGTVMAPAKEVFESIGASVTWDHFGKTISISKGGHTVFMAAYSSNAIVDGQLTRCSAFPTIVNDVLMVPVRFVAESLMVCVEWDGGDLVAKLDTTRPPIRKGLVLGSRGDLEKIPLVVIDAGHGGKDPGASYSGAVEKNLNLDIALRLKKILDDNDVKNIMTRSDDRFINLYDRSGLANKNNAGLFVSIHNNAASKSSVHGTMTLYHPSSTQSRRLATIVQNQLVEDLGSKNLGIIPRSNLAVLRTSRMPAIIAEIGYLTNASERNKLLEEDYRQKAAESLAKAIVKVFE